MELECSDVGERLSGPTGITRLMQDLGTALAGGSRMRMLGGGNPAHIPEVQAVWRRCMRELLDDEARFDRVLANYDGPEGSPTFREAVAELFRRDYGWNVGPENVAITSGSQNTFFILLNLLSGARGGAMRRIVFPQSPEYIGYADQGLAAGQFESVPARIALRGDHRYKYELDLERLSTVSPPAAFCVSRPTNPSGNVLTDMEMSCLSEQALRGGARLIVDNAYGHPFPDILFAHATPMWAPHHIMSFSLSKLGLPGVRTGIVVAGEDVVRRLAAANAVVNLANGNVGQALVEPLLRSGEITRISREVIRPFYERKARQALRWLADALGPDLPWRVHESEGALFLWLWFDRLPIGATELYERLKARGVLVVPGDYFFFGLDRPWDHARQCIRLTFSQADAAVEEGIAILGDEVRRAYAAG